MPTKRKPSKSYTRRDGVEVEIGDWIATRGLIADDSDYGHVYAIGDDGVAMVAWEASGASTSMPLNDEKHYRVFPSVTGARDFYRDQIEE